MPKVYKVLWKKYAWNVRRMVNELFVPSAQWSSVLLYIVRFMGSTSHLGREKRAGKNMESLILDFNPVFSMQFRMYKITHDLNQVAI